MHSVAECLLLVLFLKTRLCSRLTLSQLRSRRTPHPSPFKNDMGLTWVRSAQKFKNSTRHKRRANIKGTVSLVDTHLALFFFSINAMVLGEFSGKVSSLRCSNPGGCHDSRVFQESQLYRKLEAGYRPFPGALLLADSAYKVSLIILML